MLGVNVSTLILLVVANRCIIGEEMEISQQIDSVKV